MPHAVLFLNAHVPRDRAAAPAVDTLVDRAVPVGRADRETLPDVPEWPLARADQCIRPVRSPEVLVDRAVPEGRADLVHDHPLAHVPALGHAPVSGHVLAWEPDLAACCPRRMRQHPDVPSGIRGVLAAAHRGTRRTRKSRSRGTTRAWARPRSPWAKCRSPRRSR